MFACSAGLSGWGCLFYYYYYFLSLTNNFNLSRGKLAPLLTIAKLCEGSCLRVGEEQTCACSCLYPFCSRGPRALQREAGGSRRGHWGFSSHLPRPGSARLRAAPPSPAVGMPGTAA